MKLSALLEATKKKTKPTEAQKALAKATRAAVAAGKAAIAARTTVKPEVTPEKKVTINHASLMKIAEECRKKMGVSGQAKFGDCEPVSFAIAKALSRLVPDIKVVDGNWAGTITTKASARGHVWCYIPSMKLVIDATHDQFNAGTKIIITEWDPNDHENDNPCDRNDKNCIKYKKIDFYADHLLKKYISEPEFNSISVL